MTNENASRANDRNLAESTQKTEPPRPVEDRENRDVKGEARACKRVYDSHIAKVAELRRRQEAYEASLPKDPIEALTEIRRAIKGADDSVEQHYAPRAALEIILQLATHGALDDSDHIRDAIYWLTCQGLDGLKTIEDGTHRAVSIARQFHPMHEAYRA